MTTEVDIFQMQVPDYAKIEQSKTMQSMASGLSGGFGNRISLRANRFRLIQNGVDVGVVPQQHLDVVIFALAEALQRIYYMGAFDPNSSAPPDCFSHDGITPSDESPHKQHDKCATCPQNIKGSGRMGGTKACAYKKRAILCADNLEGPSYALDVNGQSMFGEQIENQNKFSFKGYFEKLQLHGVAIDAVVTRLTFDDAASVPKLHFAPVRVLTREEHAAILVRASDPEVASMLKDLTNDREVDAPAAPVVPAVQATPAPQPKATAAPPAPQPKVTAAPPVPKVEAPKAKGFAVVPPTEVPTAAVPSRVRTLDIDTAALTKFDA